MLLILIRVRLLLNRDRCLLKSIAELLKKYKTISFDLIQSSGYVFQPTIAMTLTQDRCFSEDDALKELHAKIMAR